MLHIVKDLEKYIRISFKISHFVDTFLFLLQHFFLFLFKLFSLKCSFNYRSYHQIYIKIFLCTSLYLNYGSYVDYAV